MQDWEVDALALLVVIILFGALALGFAAGSITAYFSRGIPFLLRLLFLVVPLILMTFAVLKAIVVWAAIGVAFGAICFWGYGKGESK